MDDGTPRISYYALVEDNGSADTAFGLVRRIHAEPVAIDEAIGNDLEWHPSEYLRRYYILGSTDIDHVEVSPSSRRRCWLAGGRNGRAPAADALDRAADRGDVKKRTPARRCPRGQDAAP